MQRSRPPTIIPSLSQTASHSSMQCVVRITLRDSASEEITFHMDLSNRRQDARRPKQYSVVVKKGIDEHS